jgi:5'-phosphate synthase pdxT subunit
VRRNAFGRQLDSFEADLEVPALGAVPFHAVFIRAPLIESVGPEVEVLSRLDDRIVAARQGQLLATSFHPELTHDGRFHDYFLTLGRH